MKDIIYTRPARPSDAKKFLEFAKATPDNQFDALLPTDPGTAVLCAYNKNRTVMYLPQHRPIMLESICANPKATDLEKSQAVAALVRETVMQAHLNKASEIYFLGTEDSIQKMASNYRWEKLPWPVYRLRLRDLEPADEN